MIPDAVLQYRLYGNLERARRDGAALVFHALTGSAAVDSWWQPVLGPGRALDSVRTPVLAANLLGSCYGSSGPSTVPDGSFPRLTARDLALAHRPLLAHLGITHLTLATGGSLGGMVALQWGLVTPVPVDRLVIFAAPGRASAQAIAWNAAQRMAIEADAAWEEGRYTPGAGPVAGLAAARAIAMITYRSHVEFSERFGRKQSRSPGRFDVEHSLRPHGEKLVARFDARSYVALREAMDSHDVTRGRGSLESVLRELDLPALILSSSTDDLYPVEEQLEPATLLPGADFVELASAHGHDAFLIEQEAVNRIVVEFRRRLRAASVKLPI